MINHIQQKVLRVASLFTEKKLTLATAESCTGGGLSYWLTSIPGSSLWFDRGFVTYSNEAKCELLGVDKKMIEQFGAVSKEIALAMVQGVFRHASVDVSVAITGIAGPEGGTTEKPIGLVWIGLGRRDNKKNLATAEQYLFTGDRQTIRLQAIHQALENILNH